MQESLRIIKSESEDFKKNDNVVLTGGQINGKSGNSNIIKIEQINN